MTKRTRKQAIEAMCKHCLYDPQAKGAGTWRKQIEDCTSYDCPLYEWRPVSATFNKQGDEECQD